MKCPRYKADLKASDLGEYGFVIIDVCQNCQGGVDPIGRTLTER